MVVSTMRINWRHDGRVPYFHHADTTVVSSTTFSCNSDGAWPVFGLFCGWCGQRVVYTDHQQ